jgi:hypothetical protein
MSLLSWGAFGSEAVPVVRVGEPAVLRIFEAEGFGELVWQHSGRHSKQVCPNCGCSLIWDDCGLPRFRGRGMG